METPIQPEGFTCIERHRDTGDRNYRCNACGWHTGFVANSVELVAKLDTHAGPHPADKLDLLMMEN